MKVSGANWTHCLVSLLLLSVLPANASGQDPLRRWELAALVGLEGENSKYVDYGGRATFNFNPRLAAEFQVTRISFAPLQGGGRQLTGIAHAKFTHRFKTSYNLSVFGIAGPGLLAFDTRYDPQNNLSGPFSERMPALNFGGGVEVVPFDRIGFRIDVSDLLSRERFEFRRETMTRWHNWADYKLGITFRF